MNKNTYQRAMHQISASEDEIRMKARQIREQYEAADAHKIKKHTGKPRWLVGLAATAAVIICGTVTVGALNQWNYSSVINRYFQKQNSSQETFDVTGMGIDVKQPLEGDGFSMVVQSVVAEANGIHAFFHAKLNPEYEAQLPQTGETLYGSIVPLLRIQDADGNYVDDGMSWSNCVAQNEDGSFDCMGTIGLSEPRDSVADLSLIVCDANEMIIMTKNADYGFEVVLQTPSSELNSWDDVHVQFTYSLAGIELVPNRQDENGTVIDSAAFDSVTLSPFSVTFRRSDVPVIPAMSNAPDVTVGAEYYDFGTCVQEGITNLCAHEYDKSCPVPWEYQTLFIRGVTLLYSDGTELNAEIFTGDGIAVTKTSESGQYDRMDMKFTVSFAKPYSIDGLIGVRINDVEIPLS